jgi:PAS domain S-box-containing protein/putative nucleotidyltransferase with HDIG domain
MKTPINHARTSKNLSSIDSETRYRQLFETSRDGILILDDETGIIQDANPFLLNLLGYSQFELAGRNLGEVGVMEELDCRKLFEELRQKETVRFSELSIRTKDGHQKHAELVCNVYLVAGKRVIQCNFRDISRRKRTEASLRLQSAALNAAASAIMITDRNGIIEWVNPAFTQLTGYESTEAIGKNPRQLLNAGQQDQAFYKELWNTIQSGRIWRRELVNHRKDGTLYTEEETITPLVEADGRISHFIAIKEDITARKAADARIRRQLEHLTALSEIDRIIAANFDLKLSLSEILGHVTAELGSDAADILILNPYLESLEHGADRGFRTNAVKGVQIRLGTGYAGRAALERHRIEIPAVGFGTETLAAIPHLAGEDFVCYYGEPLIAKGQVKGVLEVYNRTPLDPDEEWCDFLAALAGQTAIAIDNATLLENLNRSNSELTLAYDATIEGWSRALDLRDEETEGHTQRVTAMTVKLARFMGLSEVELVQVRWGALLHDIGKMGIPDYILRKSGPLTEEEVEEMKKHPRLAFEMLSPIRYLHQALDIPYCHHEKWDGSGYPRGLKGTQIPLLARIFAVVDVWDALTSNRPYRSAWTEEEVRDHIRALSGTHFDPRVVEAFMNLPDWRMQKQPHQTEV